MTLKCIGSGSSGKEVEIMCKLCRNLKKGTCRDISAVKNSLGVVGKMTTGIVVWTEEDGSFTLSTSVGGLFDDCLKEAEIKIKYCPICGNKLEASQGE